MNRNTESNFGGDSQSSQYNSSSFGTSGNDSYGLGGSGAYQERHGLTSWIPGGQHIKNAGCNVESKFHSLTHPNFTGHIKNAEEHVKHPHSGSKASEYSYPEPRSGNKERAEGTEGVPF